jgi:hypothetical protein
MDQELSRTARLLPFTRRLTKQAAPPEETGTLNRHVGP